MRFDKNTVIPIGLAATILLCTVHMTVMWAKMSNSVASVVNNAVYVSDMERYSRELQRMNSNLITPDMLDIVLKRKSLNESHN